MKRGAIYLASGERFVAEARRSAAHLDAFGLDHTLIERDNIEAQALGGKSDMYGLTPYESTVFLDTDTRVLGDLTFGFEMAERHGIAIAIAPACWARRTGAVDGDEVEYNTGVIFFRRSPDVAEVFDVWKANAGIHRNDQASFALAIAETGFNPFVLPRNWNYRAGIDSPQVYGPIKVWHSRVPLGDAVASKLANLPMGFTTLMGQQGEGA